MKRSISRVAGASFALGYMSFSARKLLLDATEEKSHDIPLVKESLQSKAGLVIWGSNKYGLVDPERPEMKSTKAPFRMDFFEGVSFKSVVLGEKHALAITSSGDIYQWGAAHFPHSSEFPAHKPFKTLSGRNIEKASLTDEAVFALTNSGELLSWKVGANSKQIKVQVPRNECIVSVASGKKHVLALSASGNVFSAALAEDGNSKGQLGTDTVKTIDFGAAAVTLEQVKIEGKVVEIACGNEHSLARMVDGRVFGWGSNELGELGEGVSEEENYFKKPIELRKIWHLVPNTSLPQPPKNETLKVTSIAAAGHSSYFVKQSETYEEVLSCGFGLNGQVGSGFPVHAAVEPVRIRRISAMYQFDDAQSKLVPIHLLKLGCSPTHAMAVLGSSLSDEFGNDVLAWGNNRYGECHIKEHLASVFSPSIVLPVFENIENLERFQVVPSKVTSMGWFRAAKKTVGTDIACGSNVTAVFTH